MISIAGFNFITDQGLVYDELANISILFRLKEVQNYRFNSHCCSLDH